MKVKSEKRKETRFSIGGYRKFEEFSAWKKGKRTSFMFKKLKNFHFSSHFSPQLVYPRPLYILTYRLIPNIILNSIPSEG